MGKVLKAWMMLFAMSLALAGTATLSSCSSDDDPFFTVSEDDDPRILNTDLADQKLDRKTNLKMEIKVTPVHYTTVTWLLDDTQIAEGTTIDQALPVGNHTLKIVATTTKGKSTSRTLNVVVTPAADDPTLGTNAIELWVAPGAETTIHKCKNLGTVTKVLVGGKKATFEVLEEGTAMKLTAPEGLENGEYAITLVDGDGLEFPGGTLKVTTEPRPSMENTQWEGHHYVSWNLGDGDPNKTFNLIGMDVFAQFKAGTILKVYYSIEPSAEYHQMQLMTGWWTLLPNSTKMDISGSGAYTYTLSQDALDLIQAQSGFQVGGHGFYVDRVTVE